MSLQLRYQLWSGSGKTIRNNLLLGLSELGGRWTDKYTVTTTSETCIILEIIESKKDINKVVKIPVEGTYGTTTKMNIKTRRIRKFPFLAKNGSHTQPLVGYSNKTFSFDLQDCPADSCRVTGVPYMVELSRTIPLVWKPSLSVLINLNHNP